jgi:exopolysaccharide biosynthesis WecB/TagA/CpsF family protein
MVLALKLPAGSKEKIKIGILLWNKGLSSKKDVEKNLKEKYPGIDFVVATMNRDKNSTIDKDFINFEPKIVFVCFGAPWQEKFIYHNLKNIPSAKIMLGVGGTFDFITDKAKRAPKFLRALGLEWFWRLIKQPTRLKRIIRAVIIFPYIFAVDKFYHPLFYRPNVACLLYKKEKDKYKILVVERMGESGHWQLPQGGTDGQCLLEAGTRELCEEVNCNEVIPKRVFKNLYKYQFGTRPGENSERVNTCRKHTGYKGQKQGLLIAEFVGQDSDIKINFWDHSDWKWVEANKLVDEVHVIRKRATEKFLKKFKEFVKEK